MLQLLRSKNVPYYDRIVVYLDNAAYHTCSEVIEAFDLLNLNYIFAPPYLSPLNPIENFFGVLKHRIKENPVTKK